MPASYDSLLVYYDASTVTWDGIETTLKPRASGVGSAKARCTPGRIAQARLSGEGQTTVQTSILPNIPDAVITAFVNDIAGVTLAVQEPAAALTAEVLDAATVTIPAEEPPLLIVAEVLDVAVV